MKFPRHNLFLLAALATPVGVHAHEGDHEHPHEPVATISVYDTATPLVIDGRLDEPVWQNAVAVKVNARVGKGDLRGTTVPMIVKCTWDGEYLYIGYETFDANIVSIGSDSHKGPKGRERQGAEIHKKDSKVDVVEFFLTFGDPHFFWELHHNALNQFNDIWCVVPDENWPVAKSAMLDYGILFNRQEYVNDDGDTTVAMAVQLKRKADGAVSTPNDPSDTDTGYTAELRFPWKSIGAPVSAQNWLKVPRGEPRKAGPWKMAGHTMSLLSVVQDGDLADRYYHSGEAIIPSWFHRAQDIWPVYEFKRQPGSPVAVIEELMERADSKDVPAALVKEASDLGIAAALAGAGYLDERKFDRAQVLHEVMTVAGNVRRTHGELLRLYNPDAYRLFYTPEGAADQQRLGAGLAWKKWPAALPEAMVGLAPLPLIEWLNTQAKASKPELDKIALIARPLGWWLRTQSERQHMAAFRESIVALTANPVVSADASTTAALLRLIADAGAIGALDFAVTQTGSAVPDVRANAAEALGRLPATEAGLVALVKLASAEQEPDVLTRLATAAENWSYDARIGEAMLGLYSRVTDTLVRRTILFTVIKARWSQRSAIIKAAFNEPGGGVVGVALEAISAKPVPELADDVFTLMGNVDTAQPSLIDGAGAFGEERFAAPMIAWLKAEKNVAVQAKLVLSLERIPGDETTAALADLLSNTGNPYLAEILCDVASRRDLDAALPVLIALAEDTTAPMSVRGKAVWALGRYTSSAARESLAKLRRDPAAYFKTAEGVPLVPESLEQVRLYLALAALRQGDKAAGAEVTALYKDGTPGTRLACMLAFAELRRDDPLIVSALASTDVAELQGGVQAAALANPEGYHDRLAALEKTPWVAAVLESGLDIGLLPVAFDYALRKPEGTQ